jgi:hypothetical protein
MSTEHTEYETAIETAKETIACDPDGLFADGAQGILARQILAQHERMQEILAAINAVVEVHDRDMYADDADIPGYEEAWAVLKQAVGRKVEP